LFQQAAIFSHLHKLDFLWKAKINWLFWPLFLFPIRFSKHHFCSDSMTLELKIGLVGKNVLQQFEINCCLSLFSSMSSFLSSQHILRYYVVCHSKVCITCM
jgi:hypothetical protein